jgi:hypothetical protein
MFFFHFINDFIDDNQCIIYGTHPLYQDYKEEYMTPNYIQISKDIKVESIEMGWAHYVILEKKD